MSKRMLTTILRCLPMLMIGCGIVSFFVFHLDDYFNFAVVKAHRQWLTEWAAAHHVLAALVFIGCYVLVTVCALPCTLFLTLVAGFLFGMVDGVLYTMVGALLGASAFFLMIRVSVADWLLKRSGERLQHFEEGFKENAFHYILTLRLIPLFPFFVVNLAAALLGVRFRAFFAATAVGILPAVFIYVSLGHSLGRLFDHDQMPSMKILLRPHFLWPLLLLAVFALLPVIYKKWLRTHDEK